MDIKALTDGVLGSAPGSDAFVECTLSLAEAAFAKDRGLAREATQAIFADIVGPWTDSFRPELVNSYVSFMSEVAYAPRSPVAAPLALLGYSGPKELRERYERVRDDVEDGLEIIEKEDRTVEQVVVLSRVTLRGDVAVTSIFLQGATYSFPFADVEFIAPRKNAFLLSDGHRVERTVVTYNRAALLADRLRAWIRVRAKVQRSIAGLEPGEWIVIDPDSRYTQFGLLPVADDRFYEFFASRSFAADETTSLSELAGREWWLDFNYTPEHYRRPYVGLRSADWTKGDYLRARYFGLTAAVSFGVGGRASKRLGREFEDTLLDLLRRHEYQIVLGYGADEEEALIMDGRVAAFSGSTSTLRAPRDGLYKRAELMTCRGSLSSFGGWMQVADVFVGYDSASAHVAAMHALSVIVISCGTPSDLYRKRWTPVAEDDVRVRVIPANAPADGRRVLSDVERELVTIRKEGGRFGLLD